MLDAHAIASAAVAHSNSWRFPRLTILSHRQQRPTSQPRPLPLPRHGLPHKTDIMADTTKEVTFKSVQIDALVRATPRCENPASGPATLLFATTSRTAAVWTLS
jgi:hypothetical protein